MRSHRTLEERFWEKVRKTDRCWLWTACITDGYGSIYVGHGMVLAHRVSWTMRHGAVPDGMCVLHHCDVRACVKTEPDELYPEGHLFLGTHADNAHDRDAKGRRAPPRGSTNGNARLVDDQVREIRAMYASGDASLRALARQFGVTWCSIGRIVRREAWAHVE